MGYETKVILMAVADIIATSNSQKEAFDRVANIANVEGAIIAENRMASKITMEEILAILGHGDNTTRRHKNLFDFDLDGGGL